MPGVAIRLVLNISRLTPEVVIRLISFYFALCPKWLYGSFLLFSPDARSGYIAHLCWFRLTAGVAIRLVLNIFTWHPKQLYGSFHFISPNAQSGYMAYFPCFSSNAQSGYTTQLICFHLFLSSTRNGYKVLLSWKDNHCFQKPLDLYIKVDGLNYF